MATNAWIEGYIDALVRRRSPASLYRHADATCGRLADARGRACWRADSRRSRRRRRPAPLRKLLRASYKASGFCWLVVMHSPCAHGLRARRSSKSFAGTKTASGARGPKRTPLQGAQPAECASRDASGLCRYAKSAASTLLTPHTGATLPIKTIASPTLRGECGSCARNWPRWRQRRRSAAVPPTLTRRTWATCLSWIPRWMPRRRFRRRRAATHRRLRLLRRLACRTSGLASACCRSLRQSSRLCRKVRAATAALSCSARSQAFLPPAALPALLQGPPLYLVLISLHGLVRGNEMELGRDADTGGAWVLARVCLKKTC